MPIFYIPALGEKIRLAEDWEFTLWDEYRNDSLLKAFGLRDPKQSRWAYRKAEEKARVSLPKGTVLTVSRIYIRNGLKQYNSVTFTINKKTCSDPRISKAPGSFRFWVKLDDINNVFFETVEDEKQNAS